jgi:hypothetical protein
MLIHVSVKRSAHQTAFNIIKPGRHIHHCILVELLELQGSLQAGLLIVDLTFQFAPAVFKLQETLLYTSSFVPRHVSKSWWQEAIHWFSTELLQIEVSEKFFF